MNSASTRLRRVSHLGAVLCLCFGLLLAGSRGTAQMPVTFPFDKANNALEWQPQHDIAALTPTPEGLAITITGNDPYLVGPSRSYPVGQPLWLTVRLKAPRDGMAQVFYFNDSTGPSEMNSVRFPVTGGRWVTAKVPLPPLGPASRLRFDPPGDGGTVVLASLEITTRPLFVPPTFQPAPVPLVRKNDPSLRAGALEIAQNTTEWGGFVVRLAGQTVAMGYPYSQIGYLAGDVQRWLDLRHGGKFTVCLCRTNGRLSLTCDRTLTDADGATWTLHQDFTPLPGRSAIALVTTIRVNRERRIVWLPLVTLLTGTGEHSGDKQQAIFGGLEYLDKNEPSRSEADITGPEAQRQLPENYKITLPLMAVNAADRTVGLTWNGDPQISALFDSPDRITRSGGHLLSLLFPGAPPNSRANGALLPYDAVTLPANTPLHFTCTLLGSRGASVVPAIQQAVGLAKLPPIPAPYPQWSDAAHLMSAGWLTSQIREGGTFRHAYPGSFGFQQAADAAVWLDYLAAQSADKLQADTLHAAARQAVQGIPAGELAMSGVGHVRAPTAALVYNEAALNAEQAARMGRELLTRFEKDGAIRYHKPAEGNDLSRTHFAPDANGLTAQAVAVVLQAARFSGDTALTREGIRLLHGLDRFRDTVPRGAQTWEVPLHTPDILAAANLVHAYTLGYELTGDVSLLDAARYWAWTGVPFVYLRNPTNLPVGPYATIAVLGATQWVAPNWMGLPVQWCGLVYADALRLLARYDANPLWKRLTDGIAASGLQQTFPPGSDAARVGLLPDSFNLPAQVRNDPAINPATLLSALPSLYGKIPLYDCRVFRKTGLTAHIPGRIAAAAEAGQGIAFRAEGWPAAPYEILIVGLTRVPIVHVNGQLVPLTAPNVYLADTGRLVLRVTGHPQITVN